MPNRVCPEDWTPVGVDELEPAAEEAVRSSDSRVVVAGPGAGKTELLAQRACYLLQTGMCRRPKRILAISFKRDAARNLQYRVLERCGPELARRFDSMTFDAFARRLVDRFRRAIPEFWQPSSGYALDRKNSIEQRTRDRLREVPETSGGLTEAEIASLSTERMYREDFIGRPLPVAPDPATTLSRRAATALWWHLLHHGETSVLNFQMIGRLAELVLRANPKILRALRSTYGFVFLDEFQDTTGIQYELTKTAFLGSEAVLTAVGDNKQRIMGWAGAMEGVFTEFERDYGAERIRLVRNYRSAPALVRILGSLTAELDGDAVVPEAVDDGATGTGECRVLVFEDHEAESRHLADLIEGWITRDGLKPRDICILTRNRPADYTETIRAALAAKHIEARVESELQDVLSEPVSTLLLHALKLATRPKAPESRSAILDLLIDLEGGDADLVGRRVERTLNAFIKELREKIATSAVDEESVKDVVGTILSFLDRDRLALAFPQYAQGELFEDTVAAFAKNLSRYLESLDWSPALDALEGVGSVPIMTMHKSKGLEYHTVVFVGLEDAALWGFARSQAEETRGFFVAFSRARKRVLFTFSHERPRYPGQSPESQQRTSIGRLYALLAEAGIEPEEIEC